MTENGCITNSSTGNELINLFFKIGSSRNSIEEIKQLFKQAFKVNPLITTAILCWARSPRGGAGERKIFGELFKDLINTDVLMSKKVMNLIPEIGRFDDFKAAYGTKCEDYALTLWSLAIEQESILAAKWADRSDKRLQKAFGTNEAGLRKLLSSIRKNAIPEVKMCANEWDKIEYDKIPSLCGTRNAKAFMKHDQERYQAFLDSKEAKVNTSVANPAEVYRLAIYGGQEDAAQKYWDNLPDLKLKGNILPLVDVSYSLYQKASGSLQCIDISIAIGTYLAQKCRGKFNGKMITFHENPTMVTLPNEDIIKQFHFVKGLPWGGSTNIKKAYNLILQNAKFWNLSQEEMPEYLAVLSDMQWDENCGTDELTALDVMKIEFEKAGYHMPKMIWWNLRSSNGFPSMTDESNSCMISGFNMDIMKAIFSGEVLTPENVMMKAIQPFINMLK